MKNERREFLKGLGYVTLSLVILPSVPRLASASGGDSVVGKSGPSNFAPLRGHLHDLVIPMHLIRTPPEQGVEIWTTWAYGHKHKVKLTKANLLAIGGGQVVKVDDTVGDHSYEIRRDISAGVEIKAAKRAASAI